MVARSKAKDVTQAGAGGVFFKYNVGTPNADSVYGKALFVGGRDGVEDGLFTDGEVARMLKVAQAVQFAGVDGRLLPASAIGEGAAIELFMGGAAEIEDPVVNDDEPRTLAAISPVMAILLGAPTTPGVVDFMSAGRLWALTGYALKKEYLYDRDPAVDARNLFEAALAAEAGHGPVLPALAFEEVPGGPSPR